MNVYCLLWTEYCGYWFERHTEVDVLAIGYSSLDATAMVAEGRNLVAFTDKRVNHFRSTSSTVGKAQAIVETLTGIDAQHGLS